MTHFALCALLSIISTTLVQISHSNVYTGSSQYVCDGDALDCNGATIICNRNRDCVISAIFGTLSPTTPPTPEPTASNNAGTPTTKRPTLYPVQTARPTAQTTEEPDDDRRRRRLSNQACSSLANAGACDTTVQCPVGHGCTVYCEYPCDGMLINATHSTFLHVLRCNQKSGYNTCDNMEVYCPSSWYKSSAVSSCKFEGASVSSPHSRFLLSYLTVHTAKGLNDLDIGNLWVVDSVVYCGNTSSTTSSCSINSDGSGCQSQSQCDATTTTTAPNGVSSTSLSASDPKHKIFYIVIAVAVAVAFVIGCYCHCKRQQNKEQVQPPPQAHGNYVRHPYQPPPAQQYGGNGHAARGQVAAHGNGRAHGQNTEMNRFVIGTVQQQQPKVVPYGDDDEESQFNASTVFGNGAAPSSHGLEI